MYKISGNSIFRLTDSANIPKDIGNRDYVQYLEWVDEGNQPEPEFTEAELATRQRNAIPVRRYTEEIKGITFMGMPIDTGRDSQGLILGAALEAFMDSSYSLKWKTSTGFITLGAEQVLLIAKAIRAHVQACFDREAELVAAVDGNTYTSSMLNTGWPV